MRAAVFLALEEQDRLENKTPLVNENLKKCLETKDGRLVASLIVDFMRVFHLDFSLAVFQPEINTVRCRQLLCGELGFSEAELNANSPVLLELVRRGERKSKSHMNSCVSCFFFLFFFVGGASVKRTHFVLLGGVAREQRHGRQGWCPSCHTITSDPKPQAWLTNVGRAREQDVAVAVFGHEELLQQAHVPQKDSARDLPVDREQQDDDDSFFDDPLPQPQKTYGL
uniref:FGFR1 oncogene partner (FOP) N-terminal dimerisation domain-containing protein n=1 Tax=Hippocampus comes TaxID=109280 RepID=A0A3Q2XLD7_HIPCM